VIPLAQTSQLASVSERTGMSSSCTAASVSVCDADGIREVSRDKGIYGSEVRERSYWGGGQYSAWIDIGNSLPAGLLQRYYVFAQPAADTKHIGTAMARIQLWRPTASRSSRSAFQLVWQRRVLVLPYNRTHGALLVVSRL